MNYFLKRVMTSGFVLVGASLLIFAIIHLVPGDPARVAVGAFGTEQQIETVRRNMGLHRPIWEQYLTWIHGVITLDWGTSLIGGHPVQDYLLTRYPNSLVLATASIIVAVAIAFPFGIVSALNRNSKADYSALIFSQFGISMPSFWLGIILILVFARGLGLLPASGYVPITENPLESIRHLILPAFSLGIINAAIFTRYIRSEMIEQLNEDYTRTARAFGHPEKRIVRKYVLKNATIPVITIIGIQFGYMIGGVVIIERVFQFPGIGNVLVDALLNRDYPLIQMSLLLLAATFIVINLIVDLVYGMVDPKIRY